MRIAWNSPDRKTGVGVRQENWLTPKEAASLLGVSEKFLYLTRRKKSGPHCERRGRRIVYTESGVEQWRESQVIVR